MGQSHHHRPGGDRAGGSLHHQQGSRGLSNPVGDGLVPHRHARRLETTGVDLGIGGRQHQHPLQTAAGGLRSQGQTGQPVAYYYDLPDVGGVGGFGRVFRDDAVKAIGICCGVRVLNLDASG